MNDASHDDSGGAIRRVGRRRVVSATTTVGAAGTGAAGTAAADAAPATDVTPAHSLPPAQAHAASADSTEDVQSRDDTDEGWGGPAKQRSESQRARDEWLRNERPPHWD